MDHDVGRVDLEVGGCYLEESVALAAASLETRCISLATERWTSWHLLVSSRRHLQECQDLD